MSKKEPQQNILEYAITREQKAHEFYLDLARQTDHPLKRMLFERFAREELSHKEKLQTHLSKDSELAAMEVAAPLLANDSAQEITPQIKEQLRKVIANAMQKEKKSFRLYMDMAMKVNDESVRETLMALAKDEANHHALREMEYDCFSD
jgi:rubrerythrin